MSFHQDGAALGALRDKLPRLIEKYVRREAEKMLPAMVDEAMKKAGLRWSEAETV